MTIAGAGNDGRRVLIVEDNFLIAAAIGQMLKTKGFEIIGPSRRVSDALALVKACERIDGAVLDVNLRGEMAYPIVDALRSHGVPMVLMTGYDRRSVEPGYADVPWIQKPVTAAGLVGALFG